METQSNGMKPLSPKRDQLQTWTAFARDPISFDAAYEGVIAHNAMDGERRDIPITELRSWAFGPTPDIATMALAPIPLPGRKNGGVYFPLRHNAWKQLCQKIDAPADYLEQMPAKIQMACVNFSMSANKGNALLRCAGSEARAILSERYAPIDDDFCLQAVSDVLDIAGYRNDAMVRVVAAGPHMVLRVTLPTGAVMVKGQTIEYGIDIGNSELGKRSVQVTPVTYNLVCTNGMRAWKSEATQRLIHMGDPDRLKARLEDAIPVAFAEAKGDLDRWHRATERLIDDAFNEIQGLEAFGFNKPERETVAHQLASDAGLDGGRNWIEQLKNKTTTVFDVANAITAVGRNRGAVGEDGSVNLESRLRFEEAGYTYLERRTA